jgi:hypothetical protein
VDVRGGRDAGPDVQELRDAPFRGQVADGAVEEAAVGDGNVADFGSDGQDLVRNLAVGLPVILAAQVIVVHPGRVRPGDVDDVGNRMSAEGVHGILSLL